MTDNRSDRFYSKGVAGVTVIKTQHGGRPLLSNRKRHEPDAVAARGHKGIGKNSLVLRVADSAGLSREDAQRAVDGIMHAIAAALAEGETVRLPGFGTFSVARGKQLTRRHLKTGKTVVVDAVTPQFKADKHLMDAVLLNSLHAEEAEIID